MNKTRWIIFTAIIVLLFGGLIAYSRMNSTTTDVSSVDGATIIAANDQNGNIADHVYNNAESKVILVEYGDYQCPGCASVAPTIKSLLGDYGDKISFVFRNFPLTSIHPNARAASAAAEAAGLQGKFWEMHDSLYESQTSWQSLAASERLAAFKTYAEALSLDMTKFEADLSSSNITQKISFDQALGTKANVTSTPSFFLNGEKLPDTVASDLLQGDTTALKALLDEKLK